jgi:hypothetical protein
VYELRVEKQDGSVATRQIQINVNAVAGAPVIAEFRSTPEFDVAAGQCATFQWRVDGAVSRVALVRNNTPLWDYAPVSGSFNDCPPGTGSKNYELQAWGPGGFVKNVRSLMVRPGYAPPTAMPAPQPPAIISFTANPPQFDAINNCVALQWEITGQGIAAIWLSRNGQQIAGPNVQSGYQDCVAVSEEGNTQIYELKVDSESAGSAVWDYAPVVGSFNDCPPGNGQKNYELQVWGPGGFVKSQRSLMVRPGFTPPTAAPANVVASCGRAAISRTRARRRITKSLRIGRL